MLVESRKTAKSAILEVLQSTNCGLNSANTAPSSESPRNVQVRPQHSTELRYTTYRAPFGDLAVSTLQTASSEPARCNVRSVCILLKRAVYPLVETRRRFDALTICRLPRMCGVRRQIPLRTAMSRGLTIPGRPNPWALRRPKFPRTEDPAISDNESQALHPPLFFTLC